ncbi:superoxide dismutase [Ni] [Thalassoglobus polymorphus]|uniref:Nickel-containing superoxide dismutase n=1 Tax=Thalassoglobus polymorphus TaxID=2527994 RepID=A0A517QI89_9PLAN|nr:superoxide dismutase [Ni] [Thalassoglobus polymorphus]QDT31314.1 Nickel-containing superoxide dismutase [Thalassoglobus polymorphus]
MLRFSVLSLLTTLMVAGQALAHCEVPCGIYADQRRFEEMLEDTDTIEKAINQIKELSSKDDALSKNQLARWVATKELHATNTQGIIAQYFMTQRIKPDAKNYEKQLTTAHAVLIGAMKTKQGVDPKSAQSLRKAILDLYRAYEGKEPKFHSHEH